MSKSFKTILINGQKIKIPDHVEKARKKNRKKKKTGSIRVGRIKRRFDKGPKHPTTDGYLNIVVTSHNKKGLGSTLSPYVLCDEDGRNMENLWQFGKIYEIIPKVVDKTGWKWEAQRHCTLEKARIKTRIKPTKEFWEWRQAGMEFPKAVRYPVGFQHRHKCIGHLWPTDGQNKNICNSKANHQLYLYKEARVKIYSTLYIKMVRATKEFRTLRKLLKKGYNLQILDVDGPDVNLAIDEDGNVIAPYDQIPTGEYGKSGVGSIDINKENIKLLLNDTKQPFGHGYVLAVALLKKSKWILNSI